MNSFKLFSESIRFALRALRVNKMRTILSMLGITIGIFAIVAVFTMVYTLKYTVNKNVSALGNEVIYVSKWQWGGHGSDYKWWEYMNRPQISVRDYDYLKKNTVHAREIVYQMDIRNVPVKYQGESADGITIRAVTQHFASLYDLKIADGRFFTESEDSHARNVCVIGDEVKNILFGNENPMDKNITIRGIKLFVVGILQKEGVDLFGSSRDAVILIPHSLARKYWDERFRRFETTIIARADNYANVDLLIDEMTGLLRAHRGLKPSQKDNFSVMKQEVLTNQLESFFKSVNIGGFVIGIFASIVGGFGIANIMYVSVAERMNEIGIQKSLGATNNFILLQFLFESVFLCVTGGLIGLLFVFIGVLIGNRFIDVAVNPADIFWGIFISACVGVIAGLLPSLRAARMDPVAAMRAK